jgi:hypothetical protein
METAEEHRANERKDKELPRLVKSNTLIFWPIRANERKLQELPKLTVSRTETISLEPPLMRTMLKMERAELNRPQERTETLLPKLTKSSTDTHDPHRPYERRLKLDPNSI